MMPFSGVRIFLGEGPAYFGSDTPETTDDVVNPNARGILVWGYYFPANGSWVNVIGDETFDWVVRNRFNALWQGGKHTIDLGAHRGPVHQVIRQHADTFIVPRVLQIAVQETVGKPGVTALLQIHDQESHFTHHVDPAQFGVEFDTIEQRYHAVDEREVAEVQITVAFAYMAQVAPISKQAGEPIKLARCPHAQAIHIGPEIRRT